LPADDSLSLHRRFIAGDMRLYTASQFK